MGKRYQCKLCESWYKMDPRSPDDSPVIGLDIDTGGGVPTLKAVPLADADVFVCCWCAGQLMGLSQTMLSPERVWCGSMHTHELERV